MHGFKEWRQALLAAPDAAAVYAIVRDYVDAMRPFAAVLPGECRAALEQEPDIQSAAVSLLRAELRFDGPDDVRALMHDAAHTFASAAVRLTLLHSLAPVSTKRPPAKPDGSGAQK
jgi:hypothetical protein